MLWVRKRFSTDTFLFGSLQPDAMFYQKVIDILAIITEERERMANAEAFDSTVVMSFEFFVIEVSHTHTRLFATRKYPLFRPSKVKVRQFYPFH